MKSPQAPDLLTSEFLRKRKNLVAADRRLISEAAFTLLRLKSLAEDARDRHFDTQAPNSEGGLSPHAPTMLCALLAAHALGLRSLDRSLQCEVGESTVMEHADAIAAAVSPDAEGAPRCTDIIDTVRALRDAADATLATYRISGEDGSLPYTSIERAACAPSWLLEGFARGGDPMRDAEGALRLARSLQGGATVGLRVNLLRRSRADALAALRERGLPVHASPLSPAGIVLEERVSITDDALFADGSIEIQDIGSQLIAYALAPARDARILDACAGAGGKTLHIADLQCDTGSVLAADVEPRRLRSLSSRARRCGFNSIGTMHAGALLEGDGRSTPDLRGMFDAVLVDAPCSGLGTVRRNPLVKWRLSAKALARIVAKQRRILADYAAFVRPGGTLVYATCSLLPQENAEVADDFLSAHPDFEPAPLAPAFALYQIDLSDIPKEAWHVTLSPDLHGTDGFFFARMTRRDQ
jgi:16S rRNA (cytosine967-C5)-methyltransferase